VAQWLEHPVYTPRVARSNPGGLGYNSNQKKMELLKVPHRFACVAWQDLAVIFETGVDASTRDSRNSTQFEVPRRFACVARQDLAVIFETDVDASTRDSKNSTRFEMLLKDIQYCNNKSVNWR
jgi:hypothetical protein